jgi:hypothetical protein
MGGGGIFSTQASCCTPPFMDSCGSAMGGLSDMPGEAGLARWGVGWRRKQIARLQSKSSRVSSLDRPVPRGPLTRRGLQGAQRETSVHSSSLLFTAFSSSFSICGAVQSCTRAMASALTHLARGCMVAGLRHAAGANLLTMRAFTQRQQQVAFPRLPLCLSAPPSPLLWGF